MIKECEASTAFPKLCRDRALARELPIIESGPHGDTARKLDGESPKRLRKTREK